MTPVLVTRPEPGASATMRRLAERGFHAIHAPLLSIDPLAVADWPAAKGLQAVMVTSGQALATLPATYRALPLLAVGDATAGRARALGFAQVSSAAGDAGALARLAAARCEPDGGLLLLVAGRGQGLPLAAGLTARGFAVERRESYAATPAARIPEAARDFLMGAAGWVTLFSAETGRVFRDLLGGDHADLSRHRIAAISSRAAEPMRHLPWGGIHVAMRPTETAVLSLLNE